MLKKRRSRRIRLMARVVLIAAKQLALAKTRLMPVADLAFAALLDDLRERGLLDETLVIWTGEFGRTPRVGQRSSDAGAGALSAWCSPASLPRSRVASCDPAEANDANGRQERREDRLRRAPLRRDGSPRA